jgi:hypothetical protein
MTRPPTPVRLAAVAGLAAAAALLAAPPNDPPKPPPPPAAAAGGPYDPDPQHLWNRLHAALHVHDRKDRGAYDDRGEPFPAADAAELLGGPAHRRALAALDEFLDQGGEKRIDDPLKRAWLQRDLWAAFDVWADPWLRQHAETEKRQPERRALTLRLARALRRTALTAEQVRALPDNYADAVAVKAFPRRFDPDQEAAAFLPDDLWDPKGPWVLIGDDSEAPAAPEHTRFFGGRSAFFVFLRLPGGREETLNYLEWALRGRGRSEAPQFPADTQAALVRQALAIDDRGAIVPTRLTEGVQLRVFRRPNEAVWREQRPPAQRSFAFKLDRGALSAGKAGGLHAVGDEEAERSHLLFLGNAADPVGSEKVMQSCVTCHSHPGVRSVNTYNRSFGLQAADRLRGSNRDDEAEQAARWKRGQFSWGLLQGLSEADEK